MKTSKLIILIAALLFCINLQAQDSDNGITQYLSFKPQFFQINEGANYGLVHNGLNLAGEYERVSENAKHISIFESALSFGINYRQGLGMAWGLKPIDYFYGWKIRDNKKLSISIGPYGAIQYQWNLYPELQSGHLFWLSSFEIGPHIQLSKPFFDKVIRLNMSSSAFNANSRPEVENEEYFYSLSFSDFVKKPHSDLRFGSLDLFSHLNIEIEVINPNRNFSIAYEFDYMSFEKVSTLKNLSHSINLKWRIGHEK